jgi:hypothetical protein
MQADGRSRAIVATVPHLSRILVLSCGSWSILVLDNSGTHIGTINGPGPFSGLAVDRMGLVYALDRDAGVVLMMNEDGRVLTVLDSGRAAVGLLQGPAAVAVDGLGNVAVADSALRRIVLFKHTGEVVAFATAGVPTDVCILDESGRIVVTFAQEHLVLAFDPPQSARLFHAHTDNVPGGSSAGQQSLQRHAQPRVFGSSEDMCVVLECNTCFPFGVERLVANATPLNPLLLSSVLSSNRFVHKKCELALLFVMARYLIKERQRLAALLRAQMRSVAAIRREMLGFASIDERPEESETLGVGAGDTFTSHAFNTSFWSMGGDESNGEASRVNNTGPRDQLRDTMAARLEEDERVITALRIEINDLTLKAFHCQRRMQALEHQDEMTVAAHRSERVELVVGEGLTQSTTL